MPDGLINRIYLALGSNIEPEWNLPASVRLLSRYGRVVAVSQAWETAPLGFTKQANFLNAATLIETALSAHEFQRKAVSEVEAALDRVRDPENKNAPRTIDVDVALFNREILRIGRRRIPDPQILTRPFVAIPLAELDPDYVHPEDGRSLEEIAGTFEPQFASLRLRADVRLQEADASDLV